MTGARSAILTYHSLDRSGSVISLEPEIFRRQMETLAENRIPVVPLARIRQSPGAIALTFDDGFRNFLEHAAPILEERQFPATVFVVSAHCGHWNDWQGQGAGTPRLELMSWSELRGIARQGIEIGAHTARHPDLTKAPPAEAERELAECRSAIEQGVGAAAESFAYPYGAANDEVRRIARRHFTIACGTELEFVQPDSDPAELPRLDAYYLRRLVWFDHVMRPLGRGYLGLRSTLRRVRKCFQ